MKILTGSQIKQLDEASIQNEPISSLGLMERAAGAIARWIAENIPASAPLVFLIGKGNNGGDGLAAARLLHQAGYRCVVHLPFGPSALSSESRINLERMPEGVLFVSNLETFPIPGSAVVVDALLGTGVRGGVKEPVSTLAAAINKLPNVVISIDIPSGMKTEFGNAGELIVKADKTLALEFPKLAMLLPEAGENCGDIAVLPIGLDKKSYEAEKSVYHYIDEKLIKSLLVKRQKFAHKGKYGHALLVCGSKGMSGAAVLAAGGALRSGCGLVTVHLPKSERTALQCRYPAAMLSLDNGSCFSELPADIGRYTTIGIGPGLGRADETKAALGILLKAASKPMVIDADALNILSEREDMQSCIPEFSVLTPHPGELERLIGSWSSELEKIARVGALSVKLRSTIVVKGAHTMIAVPDGLFYFNSTGNAGMAKGGSGDVLAGFITGLLARGYQGWEAAVLGVYYHGRAGSRAAEKYGMEGMMSEDLIDFLNVEDE